MRIGLMRGRTLLTTLLMVMMVISLAPLGSPIMPATVQAQTTRTVTTLADSGPGSLRQVIADADSGDSIEFDVVGTITLTSGPLFVRKNLTINGPGAENLSISGNNASVVIEIDISDVVLSLSGVTIRDGVNTNDGALNRGAGINSFGGQLTVTNSVFLNNQAASGGGGIASTRSLVVSNTVFENNTAGVYGGAIFSSGDLTITDSILADNVAENAGGGVFILGGSASIADSTIERNSAPGLGGGISVQGSGELVLSGTNIISNTSGFDGGGVSGLNKLTITSSTISGNTAGDNGGGIAFRFSADREDDVLVINQTTIVSNTTEADGGGIYASASRNDETFALVQITDSIISENTSEDDGGGLFILAPMIMDNTVVMSNTARNDNGGLRSSRDSTVMNSTIANNTALDDNGGLRNTGTLTMTNSTVANNTAMDIAGGLRNEGEATLVNTTISGNTATNDGGGIDNTEGTLTIDQSFLVGNMPQDYADTEPLSTTVTSSGYNLFGVVSDTLTLETTDIRTAAPLLGPLADNGGPTPTRLLRSGNPAINAVPADQCATTVDQRGTERPQEDGCDIGAVEMLTSEIVPPAEPELTSNFTTGQPGSFFTLRAFGFPSTTEVTLLANGNILDDQIGTDASGNAAIILDTTGAMTGTYTITLRANIVLAQDIEQQVSLELSEDAPLRERETVAGATEVRLTQTTPPADQRAYLPFVRR